MLALLSRIVATWRRLPALRRGGVCVVLASLLLLAFSCVQTGGYNPDPVMPPPTPLATWTPTPLPPTPTPTPTPARRDITLGLALPAEALDPLQLPTDDPAARFLVDALFDRLMPPDPADGHMTPGIVQAWAVADDGLAITLTVRSDARWHDGLPVTAEDVAFTIHAAISPTVNSPYFGRLSHVLTAEAISDTTALVHLREPSCPDLTGLGDLPVVPAHKLQSGTDAWAAFGRSPLGSGPLRFSGWQGAGQMMLRATEAHWRGTPQIAQWRVRVLSPDEMRTAWEAGELDAAILPRVLTLDPPDRWPIRWGVSSEYVGVFFNRERLGLADARLRQALAMAVDRLQLNQLALGGRGLPLGAPWLPTLWAVTPASLPPAFDRERAAALLDAAGWRDNDGDGWREHEGEPLLVRVKTNGENPIRRDLAMLAAAAYRAVGVPAEVEIIPYFSLIDALFRHDYDVAVFGWPMDLDPDQSAYWRSDQIEPRRGFNLTGWQDEPVLPVLADRPGWPGTGRTDALLQAGGTAPACAAEARQAAYQQLAARLAEQRPVDFLFALPAGVVARPELSGVALSPFTGAGGSFLEWHWSNLR